MSGAQPLFVRRLSPPGAIPRATEYLALRLPSDVRHVEEAVNLLVRECLGGAAGRHIGFRLQVALCEALSNAIICGNREDPAKWVEVEVELQPGSIRVRVTDEGPGFDPSAVPEPLCAERLHGDCGRGLFLIRKLVDDVHFNAQGNSICMTWRRP